MRKSFKARIVRKVSEQAPEKPQVLEKPITIAIKEVNEKCYVTFTCPSCDCEFGVQASWLLKFISAAVKHDKPQKNGMVI